MVLQKYEHFLELQYDRQVFQNMSERHFATIWDNLLRLSNIVKTMP